MIDSDPYQLDPRIVARSFDRAAKTYDAHAVLQNTVADRLFERLECFVLAPRMILDLGSGTGRGARCLVKRYKRSWVVSLDRAPRMLHVARRHAARFFSRESFVCADAMALPLADNCVDLVFSNLTLQWLPDLDRVFSECRRVLKPKGLLILSTFGPDTLMELRSSWAGIDSAPHVNVFIDMHDVGDAMIRAGFSGPVLDREIFTMTYATVRDLLVDLKDLGAHNMNHGRTRGLTSKGDIKALYSAYELYRTEGRLPATYEVIHGHAFSPDTQARPQDGGTVAAFPIDDLKGRRS